MKNTNLDLKKIRIRTTEVAVIDIIKSINMGKLNLSYHTQDVETFSDERQSSFIESILIGIPIASFYLDETDIHKQIIIDGIKRISALYNFISNQSLHLHNLDYLPELEGLKFKDLSRQDSRKIEETMLIFHIIEHGTDFEVKRNIISRLKSFNS